jgi:hypothetical protein
MKFDEFRNSVIEFLDNQSWRAPEFDKILADKFQIIKPDFSGSFME